MSTGLIKNNGYSYYIPDEVDDSTTAFIYYPGSGGAGNDAAVLRNIIQSNPNQIIIIADTAYQNINQASDTYFNLIKQIGDDNGANISNIVTMGFSAGGPNTFNGLMRNINDHPDAGPQTAVFVDVVQHNGFYGAVNSESIETLKNNEATLLFFEPNGTIEETEKTLAANGVDVIVAWTSGNHSTHINLNKEAFQNGIVDLTSANIEELANSDIYTFVKYNPNTGKWDQISMDEVSAKFADLSIDPNDPFRYYKKLGNLKELQCNNEFIGSKINNIRNAIKNTNFLASTSLDSYSSTTNIPNGETEIIQSYFTACSELLSYLEKDTVKIIQIGNSIKDLNTSLTNEANDLNNSVSYYNNNSSNVGNNNNTYYNGNNYSIGNSNFVNGVTGATVVGVGTNIIEQMTTAEKEEKIKEIKKEFLKYDELYSDDEKIVYQKDDDYKIVVHYAGDEILTLEYYFKYKNEEEAKEAIKALKTKFEGVEDVVSDGKYAKVIFDKDVYKGLTLDELKEMYKDLKELVKEEDK